MKTLVSSSYFLPFFIHFQPLLYVKKSASISSPKEHKNTVNFHPKTEVKYNTQTPLHLPFDHDETMKETLLKT